MAVVILDEILDYVPLSPDGKRHRGVHADVFVKAKTLRFSGMDPSIASSGADARNAAIP
jgi:hypothetical protein